MLYKTGAPLYINANQYDEGETWVFTLYKEDGTKYTPTTGAIVGIKSDGHAIANAGTVDGSGNVVITETQQMTAAPGRAIYEILIDNDTHGTANFVLMVEPRPGDNADLSDSDLSLIQEAVNAAETVSELLEGQDPNEVIETAVDAWLDDHPEATTTVQDGAITAPKLNSTLWDKLLVSEEASGAVASFDDGADDVPVKSLKVALEPIQTSSGDPAPDNVRPISGHTEVQVCRLSTNEYDATHRTTGKALGTNGSAVNSVVSFVSNYVNVEGWEKAIVAYTYAELANSTNRVICFYDSTKTFINDAYISYSPTTTQQEYTIPNGAVYMRVTLDNNVTNIVIGKGTTKTVSLGTTVYGGTLDIVSGVLTVNRTLVDLDTLTTGWQTATVNGKAVLRRLISAIKQDENKFYIKCSHLKYVGNTTGAVDNGTVTNLTSNYYNLTLCAPDLFTTQAELNDWTAEQKTNGTPVQLSYLVDPTTIQLTPQEVTTLLGDNVITASSGQVAVIYRADTKMYVDNEITKAKTIIAGVETEFTATKNYTTGDLLIVGDDLYKCTANIANGGTITPNTNVTKTTVAEQLLLLA